MLTRIGQFIRRAVTRSRRKRALSRALSIMGETLTVDDAVRIAGVSVTHGYWLVRNGYWQVVTDCNGRRERPMRVTCASVCEYMRAVDSGAIRPGKRAQSGATSYVRHS